MAEIVKDKKKKTLDRWRTAIMDGAFDLIRPKIVVLTTVDDLMVLLRMGSRTHVSNRLHEK